VLDADKRGKLRPMLLYITLREVNEDSESDRLLEWIKSRGGRVRARDLQQSNASRWPSSEHADAALNKLARAGLGRWIHEPAKATGGRPTRVFSLHSEPSAPLYADKVIEAARGETARGKVQPGNVYTIAVRHDDWCALLAGTGPCNCNPDVDPPKLLM